MSEVINFIQNMNWAEWIAAITGFAASSYTLALLIPGKYPDVWLEWFLNITKKISKK